jgi:hypothetical protein
MKKINETPAVIHAIIAKHTIVTITASEVFLDFAIAANLV